MDYRFTKMTRRQLLALAAALPLRAQSKPDITLRISEITADLGFGHTVKTLAYNNQIPGPLLRMAQGRPVVIDVVNETPLPEMVHWHGFHIPPEVDGAHEEGTPMVQGHSRRTYAFIPDPAGTRWYHTHAMAGHNLKIAGYTGQFGMAIVEPPRNPAPWDLEIPLLLHEWEPYFSAFSDMDVSYRLYSINGKMLGAGEPVRVRPNQRVLFRIVNASATLEHRLALPGHQFRVIALDGNPVPSPRSVPQLRIAPGERIDAIVEMNRPGVWILGETDRAQRTAGAGIAVEYSGAKGKPQWIDPPAFAGKLARSFTWNYADFGNPAPAPAADVLTPLVIEPGTAGNLWAINGKSWPHTDDIVLYQGLRNRLVFDNRGSMDHPIHLHRHTFELTGLGVFKDVVLVPAKSTVEVDVVAGNPGPSLLHCHQQFHMDFGFMALARYSAAAPPAAPAKTGSPPPPAPAQ
jgi:FtsP/CotA-like multicopper oxidase with cupredoxin domain